MSKKLACYVLGVLILGLALVAVSCGGTPSAPAEEEAPTEEAAAEEPEAEVEEPAAEEPEAEVEEPAAEEPEVEEPEVEEPAAEEPASTAVAPTAIPHELEGRDDCLQCHGESASKPFPDDHIGRTSDTCTACHQPAEQ